MSKAEVSKVLPEDGVVASKNLETLNSKSDLDASVSVDVAEPIVDVPALDNKDSINEPIKAEVTEQSAERRKSDDRLIKISRAILEVHSRSANNPEYLDSLNKYRNLTAAEEAKKAAKSLMVRTVTGMIIGAITAHFTGGDPSSALAAAAGGAFVSESFKDIVHFSKRPLEELLGKKDPDSGKPRRVELQQRLHEREQGRLERLAAKAAEYYIAGDPTNPENDIEEKRRVRDEYVALVNELIEEEEADPEKAEYDRINKNWQIAETVAGVIGGFAGAFGTYKLFDNLRERVVDVVKEQGVKLTGGGLGKIVEHSGELQEFANQGARNVRLTDAHELVFDYHEGEKEAVERTIGSLKGWLKDALYMDLHDHLFKEGSHLIDASSASAEGSGIMASFLQKVNEVATQRILVVSASIGLSSAIGDVIGKNLRPRSPLEQIEKNVHDIKKSEAKASQAAANTAPRGGGGGGTPGSTLGEGSSPSSNGQGLSGPNSEALRSVLDDGGGDGGHSDGSNEDGSGSGNRMLDVEEIEKNPDYKARLEELIAENGVICQSTFSEDKSFFLPNIEGDGAYRINYSSSSNLPEKSGSLNCKIKNIKAVELDDGEFGFEVEVEILPTPGELSDEYEQCGVFNKQKDIEAQTEKFQKKMEDLYIDFKEKEISSIGKIELSDEEKEELNSVDSDIILRHCTGRLFNCRGITNAKDGSKIYIVEAGETILSMNIESINTHFIDWYQKKEKDGGGEESSEGSESEIDQRIKQTEQEIVDKKKELQKDPPKVQVIGDIHGDLERLDEILKQGNAEKVIFTGDFIDRGPDSVGVLKRLKELVDQGKAEFICGNHELMFLAAFDGDTQALESFIIPANGGDKTLEQLGVEVKKNRSNLGNLLKEIQSNSLVVRWVDFLRNKGNAYLVRDKILYMHAVPSVSDEHIEIAKDFQNGNRSAKGVERWYNEIFWSRDFQKRFSQDANAAIAEISKQLGISADRIVHGHDPQADVKLLGEKGLIINIDTMMSREVEKRANNPKLIGNGGGSLLIDKDGIKFVYRTKGAPEGIDPIKRTMADTDRGREIKEEIGVLEEHLEGLIREKVEAEKAAREELLRQLVKQLGNAQAKKEAANGQKIPEIEEEIFYNILPKYRANAEWVRNKDIMQVKVDKDNALREDGERVSFYPNATEAEGVRYFIEENFNPDKDKCIKFRVVIPGGYFQRYAIERKHFEELMEPKNIDDKQIGVKPVEKTNTDSGEEVILDRESGEIPEYSFNKDLIIKPGQVWRFGNRNYDVEISSIKKIDFQSVSGSSAKLEIMFKDSPNSETRPVVEWEEFFKIGKESKERS